MDKSEFAQNTLDLLCGYVGEDRAFDALVRRWGIEQLFDIVSNLMEQKKNIESEYKEREDEEE